MMTWGAATQGGAPFFKERDVHDIRALASTGRFRWVDLAATDAPRAKEFYGELFGWTARDETVNGGLFTRLRLNGQDVGSLYQLSARHRDQGVPSHWTPYIEVTDVDATARRVSALGGEVLVPPLTFPGHARIALILDSVGAQVGLWQPEKNHG